MPTYDYQCQKCGFEFEREQRITEDPIKTCPECKSRQAKRLLSAPSFILKGGGWYADGYGSSGKNTGSDSGTSGGDDSGGGGGSASSKEKKKSSGSSKSKPSSGSSGGGGTKASKNARQSAA